MARIDHDGGGVRVEALEDALARHGKPEILNTDQGSQFTGAAFTGVLIKNEIAVSMDGRGAWRDNVFVERLWRSVKYEEVYLRAYEGVSDARASIGRYLDFYNGRRPQSSSCAPASCKFARCRREEASSITKAGLLSGVARLRVDRTSRWLCAITAYKK